MPATFAVSLLNIVVYAEAALIVVLLLSLGYLWFQGTQWMQDCERAEAERDEARRNLRALRRMSELHTETVARLRRYGQ